MTPLEQHRYRLVHDMPVEAEVLLSLIAEYGPITIMELMNLASDEHLASSATIHKYLGVVRDKQLVIELSSDQDHRIKSLDVSDKGIRYLKGTI